MLARRLTLNLTLCGLERAIKKATKQRDRVNVIIYADDFVVSGKTKKVLEEIVRPVVKSFLATRGLQLSKEKTRITNINEGFDFLGFNVRKFNGKLLIQPSKDGIKNFLSKVREVIKSNYTSKTENLIRTLNPKIRGWGNYYHHVCSKQSFKKIDHEIYKSLWRWAMRRHPNKGKKWIYNKYFVDSETWNGCLSIRLGPKRTLIELLKMQRISIVRHVKIKGDANPFLPEFKDYFDKRKLERIPFALSDLPLF